MNKPHKHAEVIKAWADGEDIQKMSADGVWREVVEPEFQLDREYRVKPDEPGKVAKQEYAYPASQISGIELHQIYMITSPGNTGREDFVAVANAALCNAIDIGQVVTAEQAKELSAESYNRGLNDGIAEGLKRNAERDMAIARAVIDDIAGAHEDLLKHVIRKVPL